MLSAATVDGPKTVIIYMPCQLVRPAIVSLLYGPKRIGAMLSAATVGGFDVFWLVLYY